jgi:3-hydroxybutyrate dehydrogenase
VPQPSTNREEDNMRGRVALVTGASSGIGRAVVAELCRRGARVMAVARREHLLAELAGETGASYVACSLETRDGCEQAVEATRSQLGPVEILVNNAALGEGQDGSVLDLDWDTWRRTLNLDLDVPFLLTKLAAAGMTSSGWGRIIMVSSTAGQVGGAQMAAYCAAGHGDRSRPPSGHLQRGPARVGPDGAVGALGSAGVGPDRRSGGTDLG